MSDATTWTNLLLQKQGMQAEADQAAEKLKTQQIRDMLSAGMNAASSIGGAMQQQKQDAIANKLMNEEVIPRAEAVDPDVQKSALGKFPTAATMGDVNPASGGLDEMKMRFAMDDRKLKEMTLALRAEDQSLERQRMEASAKRFETAAQATPQGTKDKVTTADSYVSGKDYYTNQMLAARDLDGYTKALRGLEALHLGVTSAGVKVPALTYPTFNQVREMNTVRTNAAAMQDPNYSPHNLAGLAAKADADLTMPVDDVPPPPADAVNMLLGNPALAPQFDAKYGKGASAAYLK